MMLTLLEQIEARVDSLLATNSLQLRTNNGLQSCLVTPGATCTLGQEISTAWMREDWGAQRGGLHELEVWGTGFARIRFGVESDRKSTRLNSSHSQISYAVFCLKKKKIHSDSRCPLQRHIDLRPAYLILHLNPVSTVTPISQLAHTFYPYAPHRLLDAHSLTYLV